MINRYFNYLRNLILPAMVFCFITGTITGGVIVFYRFAASRIIAFSESIYEFLRLNPVYIPIAVAVLVPIAIVLYFFYRKIPDIRGGGIPTSIAIIRGIITFKWVRSFFGVMISSLATFFIGVPLGNEGPCVQMGTALGRGSVRIFGKNHAAYDKYVMTGGACAGFTAATNAPISGMMFAVEEAHQRITPMIILVALTSVIFSALTVQRLSPVLGMDPDLFPHLADELKSLQLQQMWLPLIVGVVLGLFAVTFLKYYKIVKHVWKKVIRTKFPQSKLIIIFVVTLAFGLISYDFISTGHHLTEKLFSGQVAWRVLIGILVFRATTTLCATNSGITGGLFLPIITLGAIISALCGRLFTEVMGLGTEYYSVIVALGITACIAGMMKLPLTAVFFAIEALNCTENVLAVIITVASAYAVTEIFDVKSITDSVVEHRVEDLNLKNTYVVIDAFVTVKKDTFAEGKQIRDIMWPMNLFVLSVRHKDSSEPLVDEHGDTILSQGDILHVRYSCYDEAVAKKQLLDIIGEQKIEAKQVRKI